MQGRKVRMTDLHSQLERNVELFVSLLLLALVLLVAVAITAAVAAAGG